MTSRIARTMADAFPSRYAWADPQVMRALVPKLSQLRALERAQMVDTSRMGHDDFVSTFDTTTEAASACSELLEDRPQPKARTVSRWARIKRFLRAWWVVTFYKP